MSPEQNDLYFSCLIILARADGIDNLRLAEEKYGNKLRAVIATIN